jgi:hypothetical protein
MNTIDKIKTLLGMEVKLEQMKLADGQTVIEADMFEAEKEVFVVTEDEQRIPVPVGEYEMEDGRILVVTMEGVIAEIKEMETEEEEPAEVEEVEAEQAPATPATPAAPSAPKKTIESVTKESYFSKEIEELKSLVTALSAQVLELKEAKAVELSVEQAPKPIVHNPENAKPFETKIPKSADLDPVKSSIYAMLSK